MLKLGDLRVKERCFALLLTIVREGDAQTAEILISSALFKVLLPFLEVEEVGVPADYTLKAL